MARNFRIKYRRPERFTNPERDFRKRDLRDLLAKPDSELKWHDYKTILGPFHMAGTYEESVYFLPLAFDFIRTHPDDSFDLTTSLIWFITEFHDRLTEDNYLDFFREELLHNLWHWTAEFRVIHLDKAECQKLGWRLEYSDYVDPSGTVCETLDALERYRTDGDLADLFVAELKKGTEVKAAAWLLELARAFDEDYGPPQKPGVWRRLMDKTVLEAKWAKIVGSDLFRLGPETYWRDLREKLNLLSP